MFSSILQQRPCEDPTKCKLLLVFSRKIDHQFHTSFSVLTRSSPIFYLASLMKFICFNPISLDFNLCLYFDPETTSPYLDNGHAFSS
eukprot:c40329_g1_i1 orf=186-446(-)